MIDVPSVDVGAQTLAAREQAQRATADKFKVPIDFKFTDRAEESGITFVNQIVEDAGKTYKAAHYDHGNGIAAADVDGDGLVDLFFPSEMGGCELWKNLGNGKLRNVTAEAGVGLTNRVAISAAFADIDNDGDQDLYVTTVRMGNVLFENDGKGHFKDISKAAGVDYVGHSSSAVFFDYDRDGRLDLFLVNVGKYTTEVKGKGGYYVAFEDAFAGHMHPERTERSILFHNLGKNRFADVSAATGLLDGSWSGDALVTDFNHDGYPDLYVLNMQGDNHYWENQGGKKFVDARRRSSPRPPGGRWASRPSTMTTTATWTCSSPTCTRTWSRTSTPTTRRSSSSSRGRRSSSTSRRTTSSATPSSRTRAMARSKRFRTSSTWRTTGPGGVSVGDLNADGWQDILITASMNYPFRYGVNSLMINNQGETFLDAEFLLGIEPRRAGTRKPWFTADCSGEDKAAKACQGRTGRLTITGTLGTRSSVFFDLDGDGDLDIVTQEFNAGPQVFISDLAQKHKIHYLQVRLTGKTSNRDGIGTTVKVKAGGKTYTQLMDGSSGYLSHSVLPLYFGLGDAAQVERVEVTWPTGRKQTIAGPIAANRTLDVTEEVPKK